MQCQSNVGVKSDSIDAPYRMHSMLGARNTKTSKMLKPLRCASNIIAQFDMTLR